MEETPEQQVDTVLEPIEQHTIIRYVKPLMAVRLPDSTLAEDAWRGLIRLSSTLVEYFLYLFVCKPVLFSRES